MLAARLRLGQRTAILASIGTVVAASFVWSVISTYQNQPFAYMSTFTRAWEFGAGALAADRSLRFRSRRDAGDTRWHYRCER